MSYGLTAVEGLTVGVASNLKAATGVTVILAEDGMRAAVEVRGSAPGTRETDLLKPGQLVSEIQALVLAGGMAVFLIAGRATPRPPERTSHHAPEIPCPLRTRPRRLRRPRRPAHPAPPAGREPGLAGQLHRPNHHRAHRDRRRTARPGLPRGGDPHLERQPDPFALGPGIRRGGWTRNSSG